MSEQIENKIDEDSSSIVKSTGSAIVKTPERQLPNLKPRDKETGEITSVTPEQLQSIRNGLATTVKLTDQIVKIIGDGNTSLTKDSKKIGNLRRRLRNNNSKIRDIKKGIMGGMSGVMGSIGGTAKKAGTPLLGAALLEFLASILENPGKAKRGAMLGLPSASKVVNESGVKPLKKKAKTIKRAKNIKKIRANKNKPKIRPKTQVGKKIEAVKRAKNIKNIRKAKNLSKSLTTQTTKKAGKGLLRRLGKGNVIVSSVFAAWEFADRKKEKQTNLQAAVGTGGGLAGGLAGAASGAKLGAAIGTFFGPGPGTVIGGVIGGLAGGIVGSMSGGWLADKMTGVNKDKKADIKGKNEPNKNVKGMKKNTELDVLNKDTSKTNVEVYIIDSDTQGFELNP